MKLVVDTNIIFSAILNTNSNIGRILLHPSIILYSCTFLQVELFRHREKLISITKLSLSEIAELQHLVLRNVIFLNEEIIPKEILLRAESLVNDIDPNDSIFVALAMHLNCKLWTGDKMLIEGLRGKGISQVYNTQELIEYFGF